MTTRDNFIAALDERPHDQVLRAVFADWLEEHGDGDGDMRLSAGLRWMVENGKWPLPLVERRSAVDRRRWCWHASKWWDGGITDTHWIPHMNSYAMDRRLAKQARNGSDKLYVFLSRHEAEVALADARWDLGHRP